MTTIACERPVWKLGTAFAGVCWLVANGVWHDWHRADATGISWVLPALQWGLVGWVCCFLVPQSGGLRLLLGWTCLILGLSSLGSWVLGWPSLPVEWQWMHVGALGLPVTAWLLLMDRDVARYRAHFRERERECRRLRLEKLDLENERRRLGLENQHL